MSDHDATPGHGWFEGASHVFPLRVYFEDTDAAGIVYYANYFKFAERARTEMMRLLGHAHSSMMAGDDLAFAVRHCTGDYRRPAKLDDALLVRTRVAELHGASLVAEQDVERDGQVLVAMRLKLVCMRPDGRPGRLPGALRERLEAFVETRDRE